MRKYSVMYAVGVLVASLLAASLMAAPPPHPRPQPQPQYGANTITTRNQCLSDEALDIIRSIKSLKRKTALDDPDLPFNPDYLLGTWHLDWINSEVPWSSAGPNTGTVTFKYIENCNYEGLMEATGPDGKYTVKIQLLWRPREKHLTWIEADSRGFTVVREGDIGGHGPTSQQFDYLWEAVPFTYQGKLIRMMGSMFITGPNNARQDVVMSIDGGKTQRLGAPSIERDLPATPK